MMDCVLKLKCIKKNPQDKIDLYQHLIMERLTFSLSIVLDIFIQINFISFINLKSTVFIIRNIK